MQKMQAIDSRMKQRREERRGGEGDLSTTNQQQQHAPNYLYMSGRINDNEPSYYVLSS